VLRRQPVRQRCFLLTYRFGIARVRRLVVGDSELAAHPSWFRQAAVGCDLDADGRALMLSMPTMKRTLH
jgi:hypothetical protein